MPSLELSDGESALRDSAVRSPRWARIALAVILLFCLIGRVGWVLYIRDTHPQATTSPDTPSYVGPALALAREGTLETSPGSGSPIFERTPLYPALMAAIFSIHESETLFLIVQAVLSCLTVLLAFVLASRLWGPLAGVFAAAFLALEPLQFAASGTLLTESVFSLMLLVVVAVGFHVFARERSRPRWYALLGLAVATATMIRPTTYYFVVVVVLFIVLAARRSGPRTVLVALAAFLAPIVLIFGGWQLRNHRDVGSWRFSGIESVNLYYDYAAYALATHDGTSVAAAREKLNQSFEGSPLATCPVGGRCEPARPSRPGAFYDQLYDRGFDVVQSYPVETARGVLRGLARELFGPGTDTVSRYLDVRSSLAVSAVLESGLIVFGIAFVYGTFRAFRTRSSDFAAHLFALGTATYVVLISAGPGAYARFRGPVMPVLSLYAGLGAATCCRHVAASRRRRATARLVPVVEEP